MKEPHINVSITSSRNYVNPVDYESIKEDTDFHRIDVCDTVKLRDLPCKIV